MGENINNIDNTNNINNCSTSDIINKQPKKRGRKPKESIESSYNSSTHEDDFKVIMSSTDDTIVVTGAQKIKEMLEDALLKYDPSNKNYSTYLSEDDTSTKITTSQIDEYGENAQNDLSKILQINKIIKRAINLDDIIGRVYEAVATNINAEIKESYDDYDEETCDAEELARAKKIIKRFKKNINLERFVRNGITMTYTEGNYISYLRQTNSGWTINKFPLGIAEISSYNVNDDPVILINIDELKNALSKSMVKTKKGQSLFYKDMDEEIQNTYPPEVYDAYKNREKYAKLDIKYSGTARINNMDRKYGLSSIFKALKPMVMLETFAKSDEINAKAKSKKIVAQLMNEKILGAEGTRECLSEMAYAHSNLMSAWKQQTVVVTPPPTVKSIMYVEPKTDDVSSDKILLYRNKELSTLGISFLASDKSMTASIANISLSQLMLTINMISEQFEKIIEKWYLIILKENGLTEEYCPKVKIIDAEQLDYEIKQALAQFLYSTLNASYETTFNILGLDVRDEAEKRRQEEKLKYDDIFKPHATAYNSSGNDNNDNKGGRPSTQKDDDRKDVDQDYNDNMRE